MARKKTRGWRRAIWPAFVTLAVLAALGVVVLYAVTTRRLERVYAAPARTLSIPGTDEAVARGSHLAHIYLCHECHGSDLGGRMFAEIPLTASLPAGNLTRGRGGTSARYRSEDWARAIFDGLRPDGRPLIFMPSHQLRAMSSEDLGAIVAYIRQLPPVDREWPPAVVGPGGRLMMVATRQTLLPAEVIDHAGSQTASIEPEPTVRYGEHLATSTGCRACHRADLSGGEGPPPGGSNLTPAGAIKDWTEGDFVRAIRTGTRPDGTALAPTMPRDYGVMTDVELKALWLYLRSVPPR